MNLNLTLRKKMKFLDDGKLDIMFYDASDWAGKQLRFSWTAGGAFYRAFRSVEATKGFLSMEEALHWITRVEPERKINSIQFWGHGSPGRVWINNDFLSARSMVDVSKHKPYLLDLKQRLTEDSLIWFRSCNVFAGNEGRLFAVAFSQLMNCTIAGHTYIIGPWQSGLHTIRPGERPSWSPDEGLERKPDGTVKKIWSKPWSPNTIFCLTGKIPEGW